MFITFEGPDGSGKTTQVTSVIEWLRGMGLDVIQTREPGGTDIGDQIRSVIMNMKNKTMFPRTETLLFCSARAQNVDEIIKPALAAGEIVVSDRYSDSTLAYQGYGHGFDKEDLLRLLNYATGNLWPDLTFLLDIEPQKGLERRVASHGEWNRMDDYQLAFHRRVRGGFLQLAAEDPSRWVVIDADQNIETVGSQIKAVLSEKLKLRRE